MSHVRRSLAAASVLNTLVFVVEGIAGIRAGGISLVMDGIHNLSDELALLCLFLAYTLSVRLSRNLQRIANVLNSVGLLVISSVLIVQAMDRIRHSSPVLAFIPAVVGLLASFGNWCVARVLKDVRDQNPAIHLAYIHNLGDTYVSLVPVLAGVLVGITGIFAFDPIIGIGIALWFMWSTAQEVRTSGQQLLWPEDAVCKHPTSLAE